MPIFLWGMTLLTFRFFHYGIFSGFLWWFDHWFLILSGLFLIKKNTRYQLALTYLILIIQSLWGLDNLYFLLFRVHGLGITSFLFQPGVSTFEFLLLQSHFILTPYLLVKLPVQENKNRITFKILFFPIIIFILSYFSPPENDINCIHSSCSPINIQIPHWLFSALFASLSCVLLYGLSEGLRHAFNSPFLVKARLTVAKGLFIIGAGLILWNAQRHFSLPHFYCESSETEEAKISCLYSTDFSKEYFRQHYSIYIKGKTRKECIPYLVKAGIKEKMEEPMLLPPKEKHEFSILVPTIKESLTGRLEIECHDFSY